MATLGNDKITGLSSNEITSNNNAVSKSYADNVIPLPANNSGSILSNKDNSSIQWSFLQDPFGGTIASDTAYSWGHDDLLVSSGSRANEVAASTDIIHWALRTVGSSSTNSTSWADAGWVNGYWYRVQGDYLGFSTDSIHWDTRTSGTAQGGFCPGYSANTMSPLMFYKEPYYFTSNWSNQLWAATDTIHWERRTHPGVTIYSIGCYAGNVLLGSNNNCLNTSTDWYHWTQRTSNMCGDILGFVSAGNFLMGIEEKTCCTHSNPYNVDLKLSTDTIHWECCHTGYNTCCYQCTHHPRSLGFKDNVYYTSFKSALGSGTCCRDLIISSTDTVHWETSFDACAAGSNTCFAGNCQRFFSASDNIVLSGLCKNSKYGFLFSGAPGDKEWVNISQSCNTTTVSRRGSVTLDSNTCPFFDYSFPKETQFLSIESQLAGNPAARCITNNKYSITKGSNGGTPGIFSHLIFNRCQLVLSDSLNNEYSMNIRGSTFPTCVNMPLSSGLYGSNDMENFYMNTVMMPCTSSYSCMIRSGLDSSGNHVIMLGGGCMISSLDGGRTWSYRTRGSGYYTQQNAGLYIDGCPGNFLAGFYQYLCHTTDTIHWECRPDVSCNTGYVFNISYQNSKYWVSGYNFLSCSEDDGATWCKRTVPGSCCWSAFAYDSSGGYLIGSLNSVNIAHSTDSIHWDRRTNHQQCYSGFRYCNSKWYSFGMPYNYYSCGPTKTWAINQSTDSIHWEGACCLPIRGCQHTALMSDSYAPKITACTLGPNNETFVNIIEPVSETMEPFICDQGNSSNVSQSLKSTTDFIHWTDHSKKLPTYKQQQLGCNIAVVSGGCIMSMHYSSDTELFLGGGGRNNVNACESNLSNNNVGTQSYSITTQTYDSTCTVSYSNQGSSGSYCYCCCAQQSDYIMHNGQGSGCHCGSGIEVSQSLLGGDWSRVDGTLDGRPGVQCVSHGHGGRKSSGFDFGVGGASSGGNTSAKGPGGGVCSTLGNIPATDIDTSELKQYEITVVANGSSNYTLAGEDRGGTFSATSNKSLTVKSGDLVAFTLDNSVSGHPFWIKRANSTGTTDRVFAKFVKNNGADSGEIILDTYEMAPGTYHYNCQHHSGMHGTITVEDPVVNLDGEDGTGTNASLFGTGGAGGYLYKTGFLNFTARTVATPRFDICDCQNRLFYANNKWFYTGCGIQISTDTVHWKIRTVPFTNGGCCGRVTYGNSNWLVINGESSPGTGRCTAASTDSIHWDLRTLGTNCERYLSGLAYGNSLFMAKMCNDVTVSTDTIHWALRTVGSSLVSSERHYGIAYGNGLWATVGNDHNGCFAASTDTIHWDLRTHGLLGWYIYQVSYANGYWFINGESCMSVSTDTIHWNKRECMSSPPTQCTPVVYNGDYYIYGGTNGRLAYRKNIVATYDACQPWSDFNNFMGPYVYDDIHGLAMSNDNTVMVADGQTLKVMSNQRSRILAGNGGNGCNGGGPGAGANYIDDENGWAKFGQPGQVGGRKIRITWW